jgi:hypothetical protein
MNLEHYRGREEVPVQVWFLAEHVVDVPLARAV